MWDPLQDCRGPSLVGVSLQSDVNWVLRREGSNTRIGGNTSKPPWVVSGKARKKRRYKSVNVDVNENETVGRHQCRSHGHYKTDPTSRL